MILIEEVLITDDIAQKSFACDLDACKGACCSAGDFGAPLEEEEISTIEALMPILRDYLSKESLEAIDKQGIAPYYDGMKKQGTALKSSGACVFLFNDDSGISWCLFEKLFREKTISFHKPISCHLYPIRIETNPQTGFQNMYYDVWDICAPALKKGDKESTPLYSFAKDAIVRKYGIEFYERLAQIAKRS